ncbi:MAG: hypothetical protein AVDCRST_MAG67-3378, partial [uncultured Solirubrobacteraceae bacterium]
EDRLPGAAGPAREGSPGRRRGRRGDRHGSPGMPGRHGGQRRFRWVGTSPRSSDWTLLARSL